MQSADYCRGMAEEAERLAGIVSYGRDKVRLTQQAEDWRSKARVLEAALPVDLPSPERQLEAMSPSFRRWLGRRLRRAARPGPGHA